MRVLSMECRVCLRKGAQVFGTYKHDGSIVFHDRIPLAKTVLAGMSLQVLHESSRIGQYRHILPCENKNCK